jgi:hypothetical protein
MLTTNIVSLIKQYITHTKSQWKGGNWFNTIITLQAYV